MEEFRRVNRDPLWFNQINCPLYEDNCTWFVPGSHLRDDFPAETAAAEAPLPAAQKAARGPLASTLPRP